MFYDPTEWSQIEQTLSMREIMDQLSKVISELLGTSVENQLAEMMLKIAG